VHQVELEPVLHAVVGSRADWMRVLYAVWDERHGGETQQRRRRWREMLFRPRR
jgi:hypothetical protein